MTQKLVKLKRKLLIMIIVYYYKRNITKCITTKEFNKLTAEKFAARLKQANLGTKPDNEDFVEKADFDDKFK